MKNWRPFSWEHYKLTQGVHYNNAQALAMSLSQLKKMPPLVTEPDINQLKKLIDQAAHGHAFILQGGDCSELFSDCNPKQLTNKLNILLQMRVVLTHGLQKPVINIGRIAGQYAKPRTVLEETIDGVTLPVYRGDIINGYEFTEAARTPDPQRMLRAYQCAAFTLNYLRAQSKKPLFTSHEALHLSYEAALTHKNERGHFYNGATHFPWIGVRTLYADSAHVEYLRGIENPIGIKVGPAIDFDELMQIVRVLNPKNAQGKIVLIHRFGQAHIAKKLPLLLDKIMQEKISCAVICDPMHGNTRTTQQGIKTRYFDDMLKELWDAFSIHKQSAVPLAGIHFEMTGEHVTECIGGLCGLTEEDLNKTYTSLVDPRLNDQQSLEMALKIAQWYQENKVGPGSAAAPWQISG